MKALGFVLVLLGLCLLGCGGDGSIGWTGGGGGSGTVRGIVTDVNGDPVRDARVFVANVGGRQVFTNTAGVYEIFNVPTGEQLLRVETTQNGVAYRGANIATITNGQATQSVNIAVVHQSQLAQIRGTVRNRNGFLIQGARVFVMQRNGATLSSSFGVTDSTGTYRVEGLRGNLTYDVQVNALGFNSAFGTINLAFGETRQLNYTLPNGENVTLAPPTNLSGMAWTSPPLTRDTTTEVIRNMKRILDPASSQMMRDAETRVTPSGTILEADVSWSPFSDRALLGFGIYRRHSGQSRRVIGLLRDPQAGFYADMDVQLRVGTTYTYTVTSVSVGQREGPHSAQVNIRPIGGQTLRPPTGGNRPTLRWNSADLANRYTVYLYNRFPSVGVNPIWTSASTTGLSATVPLLGRGTYFYMVVGSGQRAFTISPLGSFSVL